MVPSIAPTNNRTLFDDTCVSSDSTITTDEGEASAPAGMDLISLEHGANDDDDGDAPRSTSYRSTRPDSRTHAHKCPSRELAIETIDPGDHEMGPCMRWSASFEGTRPPCACGGVDACVGADASLACLRLPTIVAM